MSGLRAELHSSGGWSVSAANPDSLRTTRPVARLEPFSYDRDTKVPIICDNFLSVSESEYKTHSYVNPELYRRRKYALITPPGLLPLDFVPFEVNDKGKIVPISYLRPLVDDPTMDGVPRTGSRRAKVKRMITPFLRRFSDNISAAISEKDLRKIIDFSVTKEYKSDLNSSKDQENSYSLHKEGKLRQSESLDNVFEKWEEKKFNGFDTNYQLSSVSNAKSLPHIHQLSDYEDETDHSNASLSNGLHSNGVQTEGQPITKSYSSPTAPGIISKRAQTKRHNKKKTNLKRRHATREKDGRSKSLTQIDSLVDSSRDMLLLGSHGGEDDGREGKNGGGFPPQNKLGIPDELSVKRPPLSMENRIAGGEFITFVIDSGREQYEEMALASKGVTVREALESRGIDASGIEVFQEGLRSPIPLHTDTSQLGGRCIYIRVRDDTRSPLRHRSSCQVPSRKPSGARFWGGTSTEEYSPLVDERANGNQGCQEGSLKASKATKPNNRWSLFQSNSKDSKMEDLVRQLDLYSRSGIPKLPHLLPCQSMGEEVDLRLEDGWRSIVTSSPCLMEREEQQQSAIWELVETEATYINMLKVITDLFLACLCNLQNEGLLNEIDTEKLFNNIQDVYQASLCFWRSYVCPVLEETRKTKQPLDPTLLLEGFCKFEDIFEPYTQYCLEQTNCQLYCKENARENNYFKAYLAWCETQKECNRLKLVDILVQPMQRITRYSILLKAIQKKSDSDTYRSLLQEMILHVDRFVWTVNTALRDRHEQERLKDIAKKIDSYDAVDARDDELATAVRHHSELNLLQPMPGCPSNIHRWLLHQGDFRLKDAHTSKTEVHVFLFTDFLLITKVTQRKAEKVKIVRPPYRIDHLVLVELKDSTTLGLVHLTEWGVAAAAFTLQSNDPKVFRAFVDALSMAKKQFQNAKNSHDRAMHETEEEVPPHLPPRSPRAGSSRASRVSSLAHSHSGSMDLNEVSSYASPGGHHPPSVDLSEVRASSASSDDSFSNHQIEIQRSKSLEGQHSASSNQDRRIAFPKTPNTLSVTPPYTAGQSLPNLTSEPSNSLRVPTHKQLSPSSRGTSYPPPSPRTLRRCPPVPQSRNPPLMKTRHVTSVAGQPQEVPTDGERPEGDQDELGKRRLSRVDRLDNRRYYTAGAIDDIKKQDTKDASIYKRLSWNYGQGPPPPPREAEEPSTRLLSKHKSSTKSVSCESVHSSSGVSSTSSLLRAEYEALENIDDNEIEDEDSTVVDLSVSDCTSLKISPHISTTYICHDPDVTLGVSTSQYITQPVDDDVHSLLGNPDQPGVTIDVSETSTSASSVQITVNESRFEKRPSTSPLTSSSLLRSSSSFSSSSSSSTSSLSSSNASATSSSTAPQNPPQGEKNDQMREILLDDASLEASDV